MVSEQISNPIIAAWGMTIAITLFWAWRASSKSTSIPLSWINQENVTTVEFLTVLIILIGAFFLRQYHIRDIPMLLHNDEMSVGLGARAQIVPGGRYIFGSNWASLPELSYLYSGISMRIFGNNLWGFRIGSAILGTLSLLGTYLFTRLLFGKNTALLAIALTAPFHWNHHLGRTGHHYVQTLLFTPFSLWLYLYSVGTKRPFLVVLSSIFTALALHSYYASRLIIILECLFMLFLFLRERNDRKWILQSSLLFLGVLAFCFIPSAIYFSHHLEELSQRARSVVISNPENWTHMTGVSNAQTSSGLIWFQIYRAFGLFHLCGDTSMQYGFRGPFAVGPLYWPMLAGVLFGISQIYRPKWFFLLSWIFLTLLIGGVMTVDPPFSPRLSGIAGAIYIIPAALLMYPFYYFKNNLLRFSFVVLLLALVVAHTEDQIYRYFNWYHSISGGSRGDRIVRILEERPQIKVLINRFSSHENIEPEVYQFMSPWITVIESPEATTEAVLNLASKRDALIVSPHQIIPPPEVTVIDSGESDQYQHFYWQYWRSTT